MGSIITSASQMSWCVTDPQSLPQLAWHLTCSPMLRKPSRLCYHQLRWWHAYLQDNIKWAKSMNKSAWKLQVLTERRACLSTSGLTHPWFFFHSHSLLTFKKYTICSASNMKKQEHLLLLRTLFCSRKEGWSWIKHKVFEKLWLFFFVKFSQSVW